MGGKTCFVFQNDASRGSARRQTETMGRSALFAKGKCGRRRTNGKDERATWCILMPFIEADGKFIAEALLTTEVWRLGRPVIT